MTLSNAMAMGIAGLLGGSVALLAGDLRTAALMGTWGLRIVLALGGWTALIEMAYLVRALLVFMGINRTKI